MYNKFSMISRLRPHLHTVILCICWYIISSLASQVTKKILTLCPLPLFLGEFQFIYTAFLAAISCQIAYVNPQFHNIFPKGTFPDYDNTAKYNKYNKRVFLPAITKPSKHIIETVLPLGLFQFVGKYFGHTATSLVPVSTVASIKTLSPLFILMFQKLLRIKTLTIDKSLAFSLTSLVLGVWIIVNEDGKNHKKRTASNAGFSTYGIICAIISMFIFVGQNIYGKSVFTFKSTPLTELPQSHNLHREESPLPMYEKPRETTPNNFHSVKPKKYDKLTLMIYISSVGFMLSFGWFITLELPTIWRYISYGEGSEFIQEIPWKLFFLNGTFHFIQAMITFHLLGEVSTLTYSIANLMKRIAIISVSWLFIGGPITLLQILGLLINTIGLFLYEKCSNGKKLQQQKLRPE